jgi:hypothetical protein
MTHLPYGEGVQRKLQRAGNLRRDQDSAARQAHDNPAGKALPGHQLGKRTTGFATVFIERHCE